MQKSLVQTELEVIAKTKEDHKKRLKDLRKELLNHLETTDWQYPIVEKLIGRSQ